MAYILFSLQLFSKVRVYIEEENPLAKAQEASDERTALTLLENSTCRLGYSYPFAVAFSAPATFAEQVRWT